MGLLFRKRRSNGLKEEGGREWVEMGMVCLDLGLVIMEEDYKYIMEGTAFGSRLAFDNRHILT